MATLRKWSPLLALLAASALTYALYWSDAARACKARGGSYYLNGECGTFIWEPKPHAAGGPQR